MKRTIETLMAIKSFACMSFTGCTLAYAAISWFFGQHSMSYGMLGQFLGLSLIISVLQFIFFSGNVVKKMRYPARLLCFSIPMYLAVSGFALGFKWFPIHPINWLVFTAIFLFIFAVMALAFELYARATGKQYNQLLNDYKARQN